MRGAERRSAHRKKEYNARDSHGPPAVTAAEPKITAYYERGSPKNQDGSKDPEEG